MALGLLTTRAEEVSLVEVDGADLIEVDEGVDVQRPGPARSDGIQLVLVQHPVSRTIRLGLTARRPSRV